VVSVILITVFAAIAELNLETATISHAIHAAYAGGATVATLPLEFYEAQKRENVVQFTNAV